MTHTNVQIRTREDFIKFAEIKFQQQLAILRDKGHDYVSNSDAFRNLRRFGTYGIVVRMTDKLERLANFEERGIFRVKDESVEDTALDLANYALIYLAMSFNKKHDRRTK